MINTILLDLDGVCIDFVSGAQAVHDKELDTNSWNLGLSSNDFWKPIDKAGPEFWLNLKPYPWAFELYNSLAITVGASILFCTTPAHHANSTSGKIRWLQRYFGYDFRDYIITPRKAALAHENILLIDDKEENVASFRNAGGLAILFPQPWNSRRFEKFSQPIDIVIVNEVNELLMGL